MKYSLVYIEPQKLYHLLGERIRCLRHKCHMPQEEGVGEIDAAQKYVSRIEPDFARLNCAFVLCKGRYVPKLGHAVGLSFIACASFQASIPQVYG